MWLTDKFVDYPCTVIAVGLLVVALFSLCCLLLESYWPSPITNRDLLDYADINTNMFDAREAAYAEIQRKSSPTGEIPLQSITKQDWWLNIGISCKQGACDNVLSPRGLQLMLEIDKIIGDDPDWQKMCLVASETNRTCADDPNPDGGKIAKVSAIPLFKTAYGEDLSELTQFAIDFALFGLARQETFFNATLPLFSKDYNRNHRKARSTRFLLLPAGPIEIEGVRYKTLGDRQPDQEFWIANWQVSLNEKLLLLEEKYPEFLIHSFGRAYAYRFFYR